MSGPLLPIASACLVICSILISRGYGGYLDRRIDQLRSLCELIDHAERMISQYLMSGGVMWASLESPTLEECGLMPLLREGVPLSRAIGEVRAELIIDKEITERLISELSRLGKSYAKGELALLSSTSQWLSEALGAEESARSASLTTVRALLAGSTLGIIIIFI